MEERITLDREAFRSLASETRVSVLKSLDRRRKTLTELSKELGMSPSTVKEHMDNLSRADLVKLIDDGHKWKYYELSSKGKNILHPEYTRIWVILSVSVLAMIGVFYDMMNGALANLFVARSFASTAGTKLTEQSGPAMGAVSDVPVKAAAQAVPYIHVAALMILALAAGICIALLLVDRRGRQPGP